MQLRDWLAAQAMTGYIANPQFSDLSHEELAELCYRSAEALLQRRASASY